MTGIILDLLAKHKKSQQLCNNIQLSTSHNQNQSVAECTAQKSVKCSQKQLEHHETKISTSCMGYIRPSGDSDGKSSKFTSVSKSTEIQCVSRNNAVDLNTVNKWESQDHSWNEKMDTALTGVEGSLAKDKKMNSSPHSSSEMECLKHDLKQCVRQSDCRDGLTDSNSDCCRKIGEECTEYDEHLLSISGAHLTGSCEDFGTTFVPLQSYTQGKVMRTTDNVAVAVTSVHSSQTLPQNCYNSHRPSVKCSEDNLPSLDSQLMPRNGVKQGHIIHFSRMTANMARTSNSLSKAALGMLGSAHLSSASMARGHFKTQTSSDSSCENLTSNKLDASCTVKDSVVLKPIGFQKQVTMNKNNGRLVENIHRETRDCSCVNTKKQWTECKFGVEQKKVVEPTDAAIFKHKEKSCLAVPVAADRAVKSNKCAKHLCANNVSSTVKPVVNRYKLVRSKSIASGGQNCPAAEETLTTETFKGFVGPGTHSKDKDTARLAVVSKYKLVRKKNSIGNADECCQKLTDHASVERNVQYSSSASKSWSATSGYKPCKPVKPFDPVPDSVSCLSLGKVRTSSESLSSKPVNVTSSQTSSTLASQMQNVTKTATTYRSGTSGIDRKAVKYGNHSAVVLNKYKLIRRRSSGARRSSVTRSLMDAEQVKGQWKKKVEKVNANLAISKYRLIRRSSIGSVSSLCVKGKPAVKFENVLDGHTGVRHGVKHVVSKYKLIRQQERDSVIMPKSLSTSSQVHVSSMTRRPSGPRTSLIVLNKYKLIRRKSLQKCLSRRSTPLSKWVMPVASGGKTPSLNWSIRSKPRVVRTKTLFYATPTPLRSTAGSARCKRRGFVSKYALKRSSAGI